MSTETQSMQTEISFFEILNVDPDASPREIRAAYLRCAQECHPDRFQPGTQAFAEACSKMALVNQAFYVLKDPARRAAYEDEVNVGRNSDAVTSDEGAIGRVHDVDYLDLPVRVQKELLWMQQAGDGDYHSVNLDSIRSTYLYCLTALFVWAGGLFALSRGEVWTIGGTFCLVACGLGLAVAVGRGVIKIINWHRSNLRSNLFVTPLYFVMTEFDIVSFVPLAALTNFSLDRSGGDNVEAILTFPNRTFKFPVKSESDWREFASILTRFGARARTACSQQDTNYFQERDLFQNVDSSAAVTDTKIGSAPKAMVLACVMCVVCGGLFASAWKNRNQPWFYHDVPIPIVADDGVVANNATTPYRPVAVARSSSPQERRQTKIQRADPGFRDLGSVSARPAVTRNPSIKKEEPDPPVQPLPKSGEAILSRNSDVRAPLEINTRTSGSHYFVKLVDASSKEEVVSFFVRDGDTVKVEVPLGTYELRYASGSKWYGRNYLFGRATAYATALSKFSFTRDGQRLSGYTVMLYRVAGGNLATKSIDPKDW